MSPVVNLPCKNVIPGLLPGNHFRYEEDRTQIDNNKLFYKLLLKVVTILLNLTIADKYDMGMCIMNYINISIWSDFKRKHKALLSI